MFNRISYRFKRGINILKLLIKLLALKIAIYLDERKYEREFKKVN